MRSYKIKPSAINNGAIDIDHLNINTYDIITTDGVKILGGSENNGKFASVDAIVSKLKNMHGSDLTNNTIKSYIGHFVASLSDDTKTGFFDIFNNCTNPDNDIWIQSITGNLTLNNGKLEYSSDNIGTFVRKHISGSWSTWKISNNTETTDNNSEIIKRLQGTSENNQFKDPFKTINVEPSKVINALNGQEVKDSKGNIINLTPYTANNISYNTGNYRSYSVSGSSFLDLKIYALDWKTNKYMQSVFGPITCVPSTGELKWVNGLEFGEFYRISSSGKDSQGNDVVVWGKWNPVNKKEIEYIIQGEDDSCKPFNRPFKVLRKSKDTLAFKDIYDKELWPKIDALHVSSNDYGNTEGTWRFYIGHMPIDLKVIARHYISDLWYQSFESIYKYSKTDKKFYLDVNDIKLRTYYRNRINPDNEIVDDKMSEEEKSAIIEKNIWTDWSELTDDIVEKLQTNATAISNEVTRANQAETELLKRLQGTSENSNALKDSFKFLGTFNNINDTGDGTFKAVLDSLHSTSSGKFEGFWRAKVDANIVEIQNIVVYYKDDHWLQVMKSVYGYNASTGKFSLIDGIRYRIMYREHKNGSWGEWRSITQDNADAIAEIKSKALIAKTLELKGDEEKLELTGSTVDGKTSVALSIPAATPSIAGVMSAEDKKVLNTLNIGSYDTYNDIELLETPARQNNVETKSSGYSGYKYDLSGAYSKGYRYIYFRGSNFTVESNIVRGFVVATNGSVESFVKTSEPLTNGWQKLPITPNSAYLKATYTKGLPPESYGEKFTPEYINLIKSEGVIDSVNYLKENVDIIKQNASFISFNMLNPDDLLNGFTLSGGKIVNNENGIFSNKLYLEVGKSYTLKNLPVYSMSTVKSVFVARYDAEDKYTDGSRDSITVSTDSYGNPYPYNTVVYTPTSDAAYYRVLLQSGFNQEHPFDASKAMIYEGIDDVETFIPYKPVFVSEYDKMQDEKFSKINVKNDNVVEQIGNILITGASFADGSVGNTWFSKVCKALGVNGYNKAVSGESIRNTAVKMYNGKLYSKAEFENFDTLLIMHVHNQDVCNETGLQKNYADYNVSTSMSYSQAYDYVLKKYAAECYAAKDDETSKWYGTKCGKPFKVVCMTHWHDARTIFNDSIRRLKEKWGFKLIELDKEIGFSKNQVHPITGKQISILHAHVKDDGSDDTETIDGVVYGWHQSRKEGAYIQDRIADIVVRTLKR